MFPLLIFILGFITGALIVWLVLGVRKEKGSGIGIVEKQADEKERSKEAILGLMESGNQPLTNSHIKMMLDIPESTATRYLEELEKEGKIRQVGRTGRSVYYEKI
ncbi:MAG: helix-turn-helix domain-containing protein [Patescibacteria group bacterium]